MTAIGRNCGSDAAAWRPAVKQMQACDATVRIGLMHHPLMWLSDKERTRIEQLLYPNVSLIMHGHLHKTEFRGVVSVNGAVLELAAGAVYQDNQGSQCATYATIEGEQITVCPIRYEREPDAGP